MCIKKVACGLQKVVKEDGRTVLEPIFVEVDCPDDMSRLGNKVEHCKTITPKIQHDVVHGGHDGDTVIDSPTNNNDSPTNNNDAPIDNNDSPTNNNDAPNGNGSPREVVCIETGEIFANATQASKAIGTARQNITACCNGKRKKAGGYQWKYL